MEDYVACRMAPMSMTLSDLEGHYMLFEAFQLPYIGKYSTYYLRYDYAWTEKCTWPV